MWFFISSTVINVPDEPCKVAADLLIVRSLLLKIRSLVPSWTMVLKFEDFDGQRYLPITTTRDWNSINYEIIVPFFYETPYIVYIIIVINN